MTCIEEQVAKFALAEYRKMYKIMEGAEEEYSGRQYVEDEQIVGNPDKMAYYAKDMISSLTRAPKMTINPYLIAKLDPKTINFFEFPKLKRGENKYTDISKNGVTPTDWIMKMEKQALGDLAKKKASANNAIDNILGNQAI
jgi:hypothetical protein